MQIKKIVPFWSFAFLPEVGVSVPELLKYFYPLMRIREGKNSDPGSGMEKIRIRDLGETFRIRNTEEHAVEAVGDFFNLR